MRRKENKELLTILANEISYERRYKLIDAAYGKLLKVQYINWQLNAFADEK